MKSYMAQFKTSFHAIAGALLTAAVLYASNQQVQDAVNKALAGHKGLVAILGAVGASALAYANSRKPQN